MFPMVTRRSLAVVGLAAALAAPLAWAQDAPPARVRGTIERIEGPVYVVKSRDGAELKIVLAENAVGSLTLGTMPVTAGIVGDDRVRALLATLDVPAERCRATALDG